MNRVELYGTYHNHTTWSDGRYTPDELVRRAIELGYREVGITDHYLTLKGGINCVQDDQIDEYLASIRELGLLYRGEVRVLAGLEIDTSYLNPRRFELPVEALNQLDYVLFEYVGLEIMEGFTLDQLFEARAGLSCAVGLAHPDLRVMIEQYGAKELARALAAEEFFIDACGSPRNSRSTPYVGEGVAREFTLNIEGLGEEFEEAAVQCGLEFAPSSDTHRDGPRDGMASTVHAIEAIHRLGFRPVRFPDKAGDASIG